MDQTKQAKKTSKIKEETNLSISEDANMPLDNKQEDDEFLKEGDQTKASAMEVDDFELVYEEGTVTESHLESKVKSEDIVEQTEEKRQDQDAKSTELFVKPQQLATSDSPKKPIESTKSLQQEGLTSPVSSTSSANVTPGNKKTPRRVQLITLSSPKSKKKLLD